MRTKKASSKTELRGRSLTVIDLADLRKFLRSEAIREMKLGNAEEDRLIYPDLRPVARRSILRRAKAHFKRATQFRQASLHLSKKS